VGNGGSSTKNMKFSKTKARNSAGHVASKEGTPTRAEGGKDQWPFVLKDERGTLSIE